ncbi:IS21 family transposase [Vibrio sp. JC009]|uniref:IS21 family transposase n=1 Tax=Vibrio sp. JC009 TaxID=2912314 RepID=UPI0023B0ADBD|nr:IS21 family transposase [Vibrio sp. JC009]WED22028.1 IS21 family transposase [Vibrio sp. JC009]WED23237.1 IS21 family transposase [Vibrio sp. JC009]WED24011.1 IS21 family transposase [Vibrio sp. JC009]WED24734.1 IS21 family transposase [Vibrio sp. JC009]
MTIDQALEAKILRYYHVEKWRVGTIASELNVHHSVVDRVLSQAGIPKARRTSRPLLIDPYLPFILKTLNDFPKLTAARLYEMVRQRGYPGKPSQFRHHIAQLRPKPAPEAYLRLRTLPAEQGQVDWGHFGYIEVGKAKRPLMAFVMVLSFSRAIFLRFYLNQQMESFLRGHVAAFNTWGGLPRVLLYDNLRSAVLERQGNAIRYHPTLLALAAHYHFEPRPVAVARGNEKGRVERAIRYIRDNFFAGRQWRDLEDLNAQAAHWCQHQSMERTCPENRDMTVLEAFNEERPLLLPLPDTPFNTDERKALRSGKTPYLRFDRNDYSIPHTLVQKPLTLYASLTRVRISDGECCVAEHRRSFSQGEQIEDSAHIDALVAHKAKARQHRGQHRLRQACSNIDTLLEQAVSRGHTLRGTVKALIALLDDYGCEAFNLAVNMALTKQVPYPGGVQQILEQRREQHQLPPPVPMNLPLQAQGYQIKLASLADYDQLNTRESDDEQ